MHDRYLVEDMDQSWAALIVPGGMYEREKWERYMAAQQMLDRYWAAKDEAYVRMMAANVCSLPF